MRGFVGYDSGLALPVTRGAHVRRVRKDIYLKLGVVLRESDSFLRAL